MGDSAQTVYVRFDHVYSVTAVLILFVGLCYVSKVLYMYIRYYSRLNSIVKSFICIIIPDCLLVLNFLPRTLYTAQLDILPNDGWCIFSAYLATVVMVALNMGTICVAFSTWRLTCLQPIPDSVVWLWNAVSWLVGIICASIYLIKDDLGDYKGLYCCIKPHSYRAYAILPVFLIVILSFIPTVIFFKWACDRVRQAERVPDYRMKARVKASRAILECGAWLITFSYGCWSIIYINGAITFFGGHVSVKADAVGAWLAKLHPILDSIMLLRLLTNFSQRTYKIHIVNAVNNPEDRGEEQHVLPKAAGPAMRRHMTPLISSAAMGTDAYNAYAKEVEMAPPAVDRQQQQPERNTDKSDIHETLPSYRRVTLPAVVPITAGNTLTQMEMMDQLVATFAHRELEVRESAFRQVEDFLVSDVVAEADNNSTITQSSTAPQHQSPPQRRGSAGGLHLTQRGRSFEDNRQIILPPLADIVGPVAESSSEPSSFIRTRPNFLRRNTGGETPPLPPQAAPGITTSVQITSSPPTALDSLV